MGGFPERGAILTAKNIFIKQVHEKCRKERLQREDLNRLGAFTLDPPGRFNA
jgi:hypothetical protein